MNAKQRQLRHTDYLEHLLESVRLARRYSNGLTKAEFVEDKKTQQPQGNADRSNGFEP